MDDVDPLPPGFDPAYLSAVDELYHDEWAARKLLRIRWLQRSIVHFWPGGHGTRLIHVAGTNGKGSTCRLLEAALGLAGTSGAMTNPHLFDYAERCTIRGAPLPHGEVADIWRRELRPHSLDRGEQDPGRCLSFAEAGILLALHAFDRHGARWGLVETGVGGRYAPSMAIAPALCILTNVGRDHPATLGRCEWQRALEKAGIARAGVPLLTSATGQGLEVIRRVAEQEGAALTVVDGAGIDAVKAQAGRLGKPPPSLPGHVWTNLALAMAALDLAEPTLDRLKALDVMLAVPPLPGRFWSPRPHLVADVAHNADKVAALAAHLDLAYPGRPLLLVIGASRERPLEPLLTPLAARAVRVILTGASYAGRDPRLLERECREAFPGLAVQVEADPGTALALAEQERRGDELVVVTGSAYTVDQALNPDPLLRRMNAEYGRRGAESLKS